MDSCNPLNSILSTKLPTRVTAEISRLISSMTSGSTSQTPPPSPLRQMISKLTSSSPTGKRPPKTSVANQPHQADHPNPEPGQPDSSSVLDINGTYHATLRQTIDSDEEEGDHGGQDAMLWGGSNLSRDENPVAIVAYPSTDFTNKDYPQHGGENGSYRQPIRLEEPKRLREPESYSEHATVKNLVTSIERRTSQDLVGSPIRSRMHPDFGHLVRRPSGDCDSELTQDLKVFNKPVTVVKPLPPKLPPKSLKARCFTIQINMKMPSKIEHLFKDETFLERLFYHMDPMDRCNAAQVCRRWRDVLYSNKSFWQDLILVIDYTQIKRSHLIDCILNTLQIAKLNRINNTNRHCTLERDLSLSCKTNRGAGVHSSTSRTTLSSDSAVDWSHSQTQQQTNGQTQIHGYQNSNAQEASLSSVDKFDDSLLYDLDQDDVWRIQELCNRFQQRSTHLAGKPSNGHLCEPIQSNCEHQHQPITISSKSSSIPSQISSTLSSYSLSSILSPLHESTRMDKLRDKLYSFLNARGFEAVCLYGATNEDIDDFVLRVSPEARERITICRLNNCNFTNKGLEQLIGALDSIEELELSGCNELTNTFELKPLTKLERLIITDCTNITDFIAEKLVVILGQLKELTIQAYHLTDEFFEFLGNNADTRSLKKLELPNCKDITNQGMNSISKYFPGLEALSISGSKKIDNNGVEILVSRARQLSVLDLSWCSMITDLSLEYIACDLDFTLTELILDRNTEIKDTGLTYLATMTNLRLLYIRWCPQITDYGIMTVTNSLKSLRYLSIAGINQISKESLLSLVDTDLLELELTNCPAANNELAKFLSSMMPQCNVIF